MTKAAAATRSNEKTVRARFGFRDGDRGTHTSRTMMLSELRHLLEAIPSDAPRSLYWGRIVDDNILHKRTGSTRRLTAQRLSELYALDPQVTLFRVLRRLWEHDAEGQPLLAFLCAFARDPLLRFTTPAVLDLPQGAAVGTADIEATLAGSVADRLNPSILNKVARNAGSSWTQSGHLRGRARKVRVRAQPTPTSTTYALFLGYLEGYRAQRLFDTPWARLLDRPRDEVMDLARAASRQGLLDFRAVSSIVEVRFPDLLTPEEEEWLREQG